MMDTRRLTLRPFILADLTNYHRLTGDPRVMRYITSKAHTLSEAEAELKRILELYPGGFGVWAVEEKTAGVFAGAAGLIPGDPGEADLGYRILPDFWGRGYASEAATALVEYAWRQLDLQKLTATTDPENEASVRVLKKLGFSEVPGRIGEKDRDFLLLRPTTKTGSKPTL